MSAELTVASLQQVLSELQDVGVPGPFYVYWDDEIGLLEATESNLQRFVDEFVNSDRTGDFYILDHGDLH